MNLIDEVKKFAAKQLLEEDYEGVSFDFEGQSIINPWVESTARFDLTTEEAVNFCGPANIMFFVDMAVRTLYPEGLYFPTEGFLLANIEGELGEHVQIYMHGLDDFAACFIEGDSSVRGSLEDIACEIESFLIDQKKEYLRKRIRDMNEYVFDEIYGDLKQILG